MRAKKIAAWGFYGLYSFGLTISVFPLLFGSFGIGTAALLYVIIAQSWVLFINRKSWTNFWKSNVFHLVPFGIFLYAVSARLITMMASSDDGVDSARMVGSLFLLTMPLVPIIAQYVLLKLVYGETGISSDD